MQEADAALLSGSLLRDPPAERAARATEAEEELYRKLKELMALQYAGAEELEALRRQTDCQEDVGIQRKTVKNLVGELLALERRLQTLADPALAAVETTWNWYGEQEAEPLFWYELTYHSWQCCNDELVLWPRAQAIPLLPWQVVYSNGYFYLCGLRLDLPADVTGGDLQKEPVFSNLRLDRVRDLHRVELSESDVDYTRKELRELIKEMYQSGYRAPMTYRDVSTIMYSGTPETLVIDCDPALMNSAVDDFGRNNIEQALALEDGRVRIRVKGAVWGGARQWLLQHAGHCCLAPVDSQAAYRRELAEALRQAAESYGFR